MQKIQTLKDLVKYYYQFNDSSDHIADRCSENLLNSDDKHVLFLLDGYDGYDKLPGSLDVMDFWQILCNINYCLAVIWLLPHIYMHQQIFI